MHPLSLPCFCRSKSKVSTEDLSKERGSLYVPRLTQAKHSSSATLVGTVTFEEYIIDAEGRQLTGRFLLQCRVLALFYEEIVHSYYS